MTDGDCDALLLAYAGVYRLGFQDMIVEKIETSYFVPPVGQGSIAVECHRKLSFDKKEIITRWVNDEKTEDCIRAERSFLKTLHGGCSIPSFGYAHYEGEMLTVKGGIISLDGHRVVKIKKSGRPDDHKEIGEAVANEVLQSGGQQILDEIRKQLV
jgi:hydroxymethylbilane synthase